MKFDGTQIIKHFPNMGYTVVAEPEEYHVDYTVYISYVDDDLVSYQDKNASSSPRYVDSIEDGKTFVKGYVKWDGCSNWWFTDIYFHGCSEEDLLNIGNIMAECWKMTKTLIPDTWLD